MAAVIQDAKFFLDSQTELRPRIGVVLGSGLGAFADELKHRVAIPFGEIPGWPHATAVGHSGKLVIGKIGQLDVAVMAGRVHLYEGYTAAQVVFGVRALGAFGVKSLVVTNAAGGIREDLGRGGLVLISDHINLQCVNPLTGPNDDALGRRFPDMTEAYSKRYREVAKGAGAEMGIDLREGVYAAVPGPSYETPAEIRYLRTIGADLVGMSTVLEVIAANHIGMRVLGISCVTNLAAGLSGEKLNHAEVLETGEMARGTLVRLLKTVLPKLDA
ncbi:MAG: purine-nucleoside phosphorylase [Acidobacteriota bacterium]|nr:purine-nucleoside phosphorylase [Acidobacteriota bacterium]